MKVPPEYHGREQSWLEHCLLAEYLSAWAHKLGSRSGRLWYVDVFAGPWMSKDTELRDTSIAIGLRELEKAAQTWREHGRNIDLAAVFVEKDPEAFRRLDEFLGGHEELVETHPFCGEFGEHVEQICRLLGDDPAFVFVDPTGFKGAEMEFIVPLVAPRQRDVLINVMFDHMNRFKDILREHMRVFFGLGDADLPPGLDELGLLRIYRQQLKLRSAITYAADLAVLHPTKDRTWFRLVVGGQHRKVLEVFRDAERKIIGGEAEFVRADAKMRADPNPWLFSSAQVVGGDGEPHYNLQRDQDLGRVEPMLQELLKTGPMSWCDLWPPMLEELHLTRSELARDCFRLYREGVITVNPEPGVRRSTLHDKDLIGLRS